MNQSADSVHVPDYGTILVPVVTALRWTEVVIVTDQPWSEDMDNFSDHGQQHVVYGNSHVTSGGWVREVVRTGTDSWRPLHLLLLCSLTCIQSALTQASQLEQELGTQSAFGMTSRWLVMTSENDHLLDRLYVTNVTMDNVAVLSVQARRKCASATNSKTPTVMLVNTLLWKPEGRRWSRVGKLLRTSDGVRSEGRNHHGNLEDWLFPNQQRGFNGRRLRIVTKEWTRHVISRSENGSKEWSGMYLEFLHVASHSLNFTYDLVEPSQDAWGLGTPSDRDTGFFGHVIRKEVDIGMAPADFRHDRSLMMDFTAIIQFTPIVMAYRKPPANNNSPWLILIPFNKWLLVATLCSAVGTALLIFLIVSLTDMKRVKPEMTSLTKREMTSLVRLEMTSPVKQEMTSPVTQDIAPQGDMASLMKPEMTSLVKQHAGHPERAMLLAAAFEVIFSALLFKPTEKTFPSRPARVLLCSWWLLSLVVVAAYSGTLTAYLSVASQPQLFSSLQDLVTKQHDYTWGTPSDTSIMLVFKESNDTINQKVWAGILRFQGEGHDVLTPDLMQLVKRVATTDEKLVLITHDTAVTSLRGDCDVEVVDVKLRNGRLGLVLPKGSALVRPLSDLILRLHASGLVSEWTDRWFPRTPCPPRAPPGPTVISLVHVQGVVLALPLGVGLALLALALERGYFTRRGTDSMPPMISPPTTEQPPISPPTTEQPPISPPTTVQPPISPHPISSPPVLPPH